MIEYTGEPFIWHAECDVPGCASTLILPMHSGDGVGHSVVRAHMAILGWWFERFWTRDSTRLLSRDICPTHREVYQRMLDAYLTRLRNAAE